MPSLTESMLHQLAPNVQRVEAIDNCVYQVSVLSRTSEQLSKVKVEDASVHIERNALSSALVQVHQLHCWDGVTT